MTKIQPWADRPYVGETVKPRIRIEQRVASHFIRACIAQGWFVSLNDDYSGHGEWTVKRSQDVGELINAMASTDGDLLLVRNAERARMGFAQFIYGNDGYDVLADHSCDGGPFESVCRETLTYAESFAQ